MDQHVVTDWKAYFDSLGPGRPYDGPTHQNMYPGEPRGMIVWVKGIHSDTNSVDVRDGENLLDRAKEIYDGNGCPEMWIFSHTGGSPWHVNAAPPVKKNNGKGKMST